MIIEPSGVVFVGVCDIQTDKCTAKQPAAIGAVWTTPGRRQVNVCTPCLEEQIRLGEWEIQGARIHPRADITAYSPDHKLQLVVEVKSRVFPSATAREQATRVYRNLLAHSGIPSSPYFLAYFHPGHFFLWKNPKDAEPTYAIYDESILKPYVTPGLTPLELEAAVAHWLEDIAHKKTPVGPSLNWLVESGLYDVLKNSSITTEIPMAA